MRQLTTASFVGLLSLTFADGCRVGFEEFNGTAFAGATSTGGRTQDPVGGRSNSGGDSGSGTGGSASGGSPTSTGGLGQTDGGSASGGGASGGSAAGGAVSSGGASSGGASSGGADTGGTAGVGGAGSGGNGGSAAGGAGAGGSGGAGGGGPITTLVVNTALDESDPGASPSSPGQTGLSLREAISIANMEPGAQEITFSPSGPTIVLTGSLPTITDSLTIRGAAVLDGAATSGAAPCLEVSGSDVLIDALEIKDCSGEPVLFSLTTGTGNQISNCYLHDNGRALTLFGGGAVVFFNYVALSGAAGIEIFGEDVQVLANQIVLSLGANLVVHTGADGAFLLANVSIGGDDGIALGALTGATIWHNTIVDSFSSSLDLGTATAIDARNNIFSGAGTYGILGSTAQLTWQDYNLFFDNTSGNCSACTVGAGSVLVDPMFNNPVAWDYSLKSGSPAINAGVDLGQDRTPGTIGNFNGTAPDLGFIEAP